VARFFMAAMLLGTEVFASATRRTLLEHKPSTLPRANLHAGKIARKRGRSQAPRNNEHCNLGAFVGQTSPCRGPLTHSPMKSLTPHLPLTLVLLAAGCAQAEFVPVNDGAVGPADAKDIGTASDASDTGDSSPGPEAPPICSAPSASGCTPAVTDPCDPVCQVGSCDWCTQKCSYAYAEDNTRPEPACASKGEKPAFATCTPSLPGTPQQFDDCSVGSICLPAFLGDSQRYCFSLCRSPVDCPGGVECGPRPLSPAGGMVDVCDPSYDTCGVDAPCCDPLADTGCGADRYCLLVSPDPSGHSRTVCEYAYGDGRNGSACTSARDCLTGNVCVNGACMLACDSTRPCVGGTTCVSLGAEYGYCP
jgi:hypothetical protein